MQCVSLHMGQSGVQTGNSEKIAPRIHDTIEVETRTPPLGLSDADAVSDASRGVRGFYSAPGCGWPAASQAKQRKSATLHTSSTSESTRPQRAQRDVALPIGRSEHIAKDCGSTATIHFLSPAAPHPCFASCSLRTQIVWLAPSLLAILTSHSSYAAACVSVAAGASPSAALGGIIPSQLIASNTENTSPRT